MRRFACLALLAWSAFGAPDAAILERMPLRFEQSAEAAWSARSLGFGVGVNRDGAVMLLGKEALELRFVNADPHAGFAGERKSATANTYFHGRGAETRDAYLRLRRTGVYPGVDVVYYGAGQSLEYDFELAPGADPAQIRMRFSGAREVRLTTDGSLALTMGAGEIVQKAPVTFQRKASGEIATVASHYVANADGSYSIRLGEYDASRTLVIDPQMLFSAYLAGLGSEAPVAIGRDKNNSIYVTGQTSSDDFPLVGEAYSGALDTPNLHVFTSKLNPLSTGDDVITYSGYFGGQFGDTLRASVVDSEGVIYMTGITDDFFFPTTENAYATENGETRKIFVSVLDTKLPGESGLIYSTFFGPNTGTFEPQGIALGPTPGQLFITGYTDSTEFPVKNAFQSQRTLGFDAFVAAFDITRSGADSLLASTYLGGSFFDRARSIAVDSAGMVYVAGVTFSYDFPMTPGGYQTSYRGGSDAFLTKLDLLGASLEYSTFIGGGTIDEAYRVLVDDQNRAILAGFTLSQDYPTTPNGFQRTLNGVGDAMIAVLDLTKSNPAEALVYSTLYGGSDGDFITDMRIGPGGRYYLGGYTLSRDLPVVDALRPASEQGGIDGLVAIVDITQPPAQALVYSSYVTGKGTQDVRAIEVDPAGNVYVTGQSIGGVFSTGGAPALPDGGSDVYLFVFRPTDPQPVRIQGGEAPQTTRSRR